MNHPAGLVGLDARQVMERFRPTARWMQRLGAWRARKIDVSLALLEQALADPELGEALLAPRFLPRTGERLAPATLEELPRDLPELTLLEVPDDWQMLALAEEVDAQRGWQDAPMPTAGAPATTLPAVTPPSEHRLLDAESALVFRPREVAELKVAILAGTSDDERRAALRRIALSGIAPREQGLLYLVALREGGDALRTEAATALGQLGMNADLVRALRTLSASEMSARHHALERLQALALDLESWEAEVTAGVLVTLAAEAEGTLRAQVLHALTAYAPTIVAVTSLERALIETLVPLALAHAMEIPGAIVEIFAALAHADPQRMVEVLGRESETLDGTPAAARARSLIDVAALGAARDSGAAAALAERVVAGLGVWSPLDLAHGLIEARLVAAGALGLAAIELRLAHAPANEAVELIGLIERLVARTDDPELVAVAAQILARQLEGAGAMVSSLIRRSSLLRDPRLTQDSRAELARAIVAEAHRESDPLLAAEILEATGTLGGAALPAIVDEIAGVRAPRDLAVYLELMTRAAASEHPATRESVTAALAIARAGFFDVIDPDAVAAKAVIAYGALARAADLDPEAATLIAEELRTALWKTALTAAAITALGHVAVAASLPPAERVAVTDLLMRLASARLPSAQGRVVQGKGGVVYDLDDSEVYTTRLPALLDALRLIGVSRTVAPTLRQRVAETLIGRWREVKSYRVIWGPANLSRLAEVLVDIAVARDLDAGLRGALLGVLGTHARELSIATLLARAAADLAEESNLDSFFAQVAAALIELERDPALRTQLEDRELILSAMAKLLERPRLLDTQGRDLRPLLWNALHSGTRDRVPGIAGKVRRLAQHASTTALERETLARRSHGR